jgi:predicted hotdog family 3-hydroxylacyl-ACP dehydratase
MDCRETPIEALIPHRDRMRLIDTVLEVDDDKAVTAAIVTEDWPLCRDGFVDTLVTVELVAQTAALLEGWKRLKTGRGSVSGWLVGIKTADFHRPGLPVAATLVTEVTKSYALESYAVFGGTVSLGDQIVAVVSIQTVRAEEAT